MVHSHWLGHAVAHSHWLGNAIDHITQTTTPHPTTPHLTTSHPTTTVPVQMGDNNDYAPVGRFIHRYRMRCFNKLVGAELDDMDTYSNCVSTAVA